MSKNITIQEGGSAVQLTADKLKTDQVGGGSVRWVPEDEVSLGTKHITENGTYEAAADGKYGYSTVTVSVPGGPDGPASDTPGSIITGIDPDDGEEYTWETVEDPETGETNVIKKPMPSGIQITALPSDLDYTDGETIDFSGIVVKLKKHDGTVYTDENYPDGVIPFSELTFPTTVADIDKTSGMGFISDLDTSPLVKPIPVNGRVVYRRDRENNPPWWSEAHDHTEIIADPGNKLILVIFMTWTYIICVSADPTPVAHIYATDEMTGITIETPMSGHSSGGANIDSFTYAGMTVYLREVWAGVSPGASGSELITYTVVSGVPAFDDESVIGPVGEAWGPAAWTVVYGTAVGGKQTIPVQWTPPASKFDYQKTRSTTYQITVTSSLGGNA